MVPGPNKESVCICCYCEMEESQVRWRDEKVRVKNIEAGDICHES